MGTCSSKVTYDLALILLSVVHNLYNGAIGTCENLAKTHHLHKTLIIKKDITIPSAVSAGTFSSSGVLASTEPWRAERSTAMPSLVLMPTAGAARDY